MKPTVVLPSQTTLKSLVVIDDDARTEALVKTLFHDATFGVMYIPNGKLGLDLALFQHTRGTMHPVVLINLEMHGVDGLESVRKLRRDGFTQPIIALSTDTSWDDCKHAGCCQLLRKPVTSTLLLSIVEPHLAW